MESWYWTIDWPDRKTALPATETAVNSVLEPFMLASMSAIRPPQPSCAPSTAPACQVDCWSLCENRFAGTGTDLALYCTLVIGWIRVPTLATTASRPWSNRVFIGAMNGCRAKVRLVALVPAGVACWVRGAMGSTPPQASGDWASETLPVTGLTWPIGVGAVPTGIRAIGSEPVLRAVK